MSTSSRVAACTQAEVCHCKVFFQLRVKNMTHCWRITVNSTSILWSFQILVDCSSRISSYGLNLSIFATVEDFIVKIHGDPTRNYDPSCRTLWRFRHFHSMKNGACARHMVYNQQHSRPWNRCWIYGEFPKNDAKVSVDDVMCFGYWINLLVDQEKTCWIIPDFFLHTMWQSSDEEHGKVHKIIKVSFLIGRLELPNANSVSEIPP